MTKYLIDTNVTSELTRDRPDANIVAFLTSIDRTNFYVSVMTVGEIAKGIEKLPISHRRGNLQLWLNTEVRIWFAGRILPVTEAIAERWGILSADSSRRGTPLPVVDGLIAATAVEHGLVLATRNTKDFSGLGIELVNPWVETK